MTPSRIFIVLMVVLALFQAVHYGPLLPDRIAAHFGEAGQPDGWGSKTTFLAGNLIFAAAIGLLFVGLTSLFPRLPNAWINMPNKDYWLAPDRRAATLNAVQRQMEWLGAGTLVLLIALTQLTIEANLENKPLEGRSFAVLFGAYMVFMVVGLVAFVRWAFRRPPAAFQK